MDPEQAGAGESQELSFDIPERILDNEDDDVMETSTPSEDASSSDPCRNQWRRTNRKLHLWPGYSDHFIPLGICAVSLFCSALGAFHCSFFFGATISFTGGHYGLWSLEDLSGKCQLWDVLFFSYDLGPPLRAARVFSMTNVLVGLSLLTTMVQAQQFHAASWLIGFSFVILFLVSVSTTSIFNVWIVFSLFSYVIMILLVRAAFIHPIHRRISERGSQIISGLFLLCFVLTLLSLIVLKSNFCTCKNISAATLEGREPGNPCEGTCRLGVAGYFTVVSAAGWLASSVSVLKYGVQPPILLDANSRRQLYGHYPRASITSRAITVQRHIVTSAMGAIRLASHTLTPWPSKDFDRRSSVSHPSEDTNDPPRPQSEKTVDLRPWRQRLCCDYRIKPRNRQEQIRFWSFRVALGLLIGIYMFLIVILIGSRNENTKAAKAPDTSIYFITDTVCAFDPLDPQSPFVTFDSRSQATEAGFLVAHCGTCSSCSNPADIEIYVKTRKTIAKSAKRCGPKAILGSYGELVECLEERIGFSRDCTYCWADNMRTTASNCLFTCMVTMFTGFMSNNNVAGAGEDGWLNQCLFCDEKISGPAFVTCSGVARRRLGIRSEIERNPAEQCPLVDVEWLSVNWQELWSGNYQNE